MKEIKASVIMPVYNAENYLEQCLDSLLCQTLKDIEIICVDDGSLDKSPDILKRYAEADSRIKLIFQKNMYAGVARNRGLAAAAGKYVIFLDSDDFFAPNMLESTVAAAENHGADIVLFGGRRYDNLNKTTGAPMDFLRTDLMPKSEVFTPQEAGANLFAMSNPAPWCKLYSRSFITAERLQFQALPNANDYYFTMCSLALAEKITAVRQELVFYRVNNTASTQGSKHKSPLNFLAAINALYCELESRGIFEAFQTAFRYSALSSIVRNLATVSSDEARLQILEALETEPYSRLPLAEMPGDAEKTKMVHVYSRQLETAMAWYRRTAPKKAAEPVPVVVNDNGINPPPQDLRGGISASVIIPVYNTEDYLDEMLGSITGQTLQNIEIICINDGSTDGSLEKLKSLAQKDSRIRLFTQENAGLSATRNAGIDRARGKYIYFMDSDDVLDANALLEATAVMDEKELDALYFDADTFYETPALERELANYKNAYMRSRSYDGVYDGATLMRLFMAEDKVLASACMQVLKTDFLRENNIRFIENIIYEDNAFSFAVMLKGRRTSHMQRAYFHRRIRGNSIITKAVTFNNSFSYYVAFRDMVQTYCDSKPFLSKENSEAAESEIMAILRSAQQSYAKLEHEYDKSELGMRLNYRAFCYLVITGAISITAGIKRRELIQEKDRLKGEAADLKEIFARLKNYITARFDIKLEGDAADWQTAEISDPRARQTQPAWFQKGGCGRIIQSSKEAIDIKLKINTPGKLQITLRGEDVRGDNAQRIDCFIDLKSAAVNGMPIIDLPQAVSYAKPVVYKANVKAGDTIALHAEWGPRWAGEPGGSQTAELQDEIAALRQANKTQKEKLDALKKKSKAQNKKLDEMRNKNAELDMKNKAQEKKIKALNSCVPMRLGKALTRPLRKLKKLLKLPGN
ncbi:MAG: glycosyltransferase [Clostridiales bacterium]|nr:glycosyltransferase [Clostridiales bacterium]